jgi:protein tyrosine phosphatase (PTP) superfamily phosphohydrolase (DUF442 family)
VIPVAFENLSVADIDFDRDNPRIRRFLEMYPDPNPEQIYLALGAGGEAAGEGSSSFDKLKNSILSSRGIVQPIIVNRVKNRTICIEGNTRVAIYRSFIEEGVTGDWSQIPAMVYTDLPEDRVDAIRLQVHLVGPRPWDPYSKAKYLHYLRTQELQPFERIVDFCGGAKRVVQESINAYSDMEKYYRPLVDEGKYDLTRFSGFVELQKSKIKDALFTHGFSIGDFAQWIHDRKIDPLSTVRQLPGVLGNPKTRQIFLKQGMKKAIAALDRPDLEVELGQATLGQLARALTEAIRRIDLPELKRLRANPDDETVRTVYEAIDELQGPVSSGECKSVARCMVCVMWPLSMFQVVAPIVSPWPSPTRKATSACSIASARSGHRYRPRASSIAARWSPKTCEDDEMNDKEFSELQLRMAIVPQQARWPAPDLVHWQWLHAVADKARERVNKACAQMDEIDRNPDLSREGKERQRRKTWAQAIADFEASKTLACARQAVEFAVGKPNIEPEARDATLRALKEAEAGWQRAVDKIGERASLTKGPNMRR